MRRIPLNRPRPPQPGGCYWVSAFPLGDPHRLTWDGWWQSGNYTMAIPQWRCLCGQRTAGEAVRLTPDEIATASPAMTESVEEE